MKRQYKFNPLPWIIDPREFITHEKVEYSKRFPSRGTPSRNPFSYCIMYLVVTPEKTMRIDFKFPQDVPLQMTFFHKRPYGAEPGEQVNNIDFREVSYRSFSALARGEGIPPCSQWTIICDCEHSRIVHLY